jgi:two-component system NtrC family sensor kinase
MFIDIEEKSAILVIDSDPALREHLDEMFNGAKNASLSDSQDDLSYIIHGCKSCAEAQERIETRKANDTPYELIFVDTVLDDGEGLILIKNLWKIDPDIHVVLCTADKTLSWQQVVNHLGESDQLLILQKPFIDLALRQIVHAMMRKWQLSRQSQHVMKFMESQIQERTKAIEEATQNLLQSEKLAAIGQLAAGIAHEINTPAQYVGDNIRALNDFFSSITRLLDHYRHLLEESHLDPLLKSARAQEEQEDLAFILEDAPLAIAQALQGMDQVVRIVQAMKGFSHAGQSRASAVNINLALENTLLVASNNYKYIADIETQFSEIPTIECFPGELNQVFLNIILNAAHAIEDSQKGRGKITIATTPSETGIIIRISDTGTGIPEGIRDRIFDPFFTTKDVGRGTGQGLNIAYRIIHEQHGGTITYQTESGLGTTFIIGLNRFLPNSTS